MHKPPVSCLFLLFMVMPYLSGGLQASARNPAVVDSLQAVPTLQQPLTEAQMDAVRQRLVEAYADKANSALDKYVKAQQAFYRSDYLTAMRHIDQAVALIRNADILAMKGAIYFKAGHQVEAREAFRKAFEAAKDPVVPQVEGLTDWLRSNGIIK
jgi:Flp pilus assembly protein TadD